MAALMQRSKMPFADLEDWLPFIQLGIGIFLVVGAMYWMRAIIRHSRTVQGEMKLRAEQSLANQEHEIELLAQIAENHQRMIQLLEKISDRRSLS
jgi:hypothetical protein